MPYPVQFEVDLHGIRIVLQFNIQEDFDMSAQAAVLAWTAYPRLRGHASGNK